MNKAHRILVQYGYTSWRISPCPYRGCEVDENGESSCGHIACPVCGVGPPTVTPDLMVCGNCFYRWHPGPPV